MTIMKLLLLLITVMVPLGAMQTKEQKEQALIQDFKRALNTSEITPEFMLKQLNALDKSELSARKLTKIATRQAICELDIYEKKRVSEDLIQSRYDKERRGTYENN